MKKIIKSILILPIVTSSCFSFGYQDTIYMVKNTSDKPLHVKAGIMKNSSIMGPHEVTRDFTVKPKDSLIITRLNVRENMPNPQAIFSTFEIFPADGVILNDHNQPLNWKKGMQEAINKYTFILNK